MDEYQRIFKLASIFLSYPEEESMGRVELEQEIALIDNKIVKFLFKQFFQYVSSLSFFELSEVYSTTFDFSDKNTLYLTYPIFGENPERGKGLVKLRQEFLQAGLPLESDELPDYFPLLLEFCSIAPIKSVQKMWMVHRKAIDMLLKELTNIDSPYQLIVQACIQAADLIADHQEAS